MNRSLQCFFMGAVTLISVALIWFLPKLLVEMGFLGRDFAKDWILFLFAATLVLPLWGICVYSFYRERTPKLLTLISWLVPLGVLVFYARTTGTYRAAVIAISMTSLLISGNGLGRSFFGGNQLQPRKWIVIVWIIIAVVSARFCLMRSSLFFSIGVGLLIISGAYLYYYSVHCWVRRIIVILALVQILLFAILLSDYGFLLPDYLIIAVTPLLLFMYGFTETRWSR